MQEKPSPIEHFVYEEPDFIEAGLQYLNQYQGGMCTSGSLTMTERTPRHLISPLGPNCVGTDSAVQRYVHFTLALV